MTVREKNLSALKKYNPEIYDSVIDTDDNGLIEVVESKKGGFVPAFNEEGKKLFIHSRFDPVKEARRFIGEIDAGKHDLFIVFGFGFAYHIEELLRGMGKDSTLLVIEKSAAILKKALSCRDLISILNDDRLMILINPDEDTIGDTLKGKSSRKSSLITHRGSFQTDPEYYSNILEIARSYLSTKDVNIATLAKFEKIWSANLARNIKKFISSPGVNIFFNKFNGIPAIVVAAGPSLNRCIDFIRNHKDDAVIVAVDTSYGILLNNGIEPHFCIVVDPQVVNARYFEGIGSSRTILIADPTVHPSVFRLFEGSVATTGVAFQLMKWIERIAGEKGEVAHGGSVSTNAYDFAKSLGAAPVILVGQDLAFTNGFAHAKGSYLDEQIHLQTNRLSNAVMFNRFQLTALPKIFVKGIRSEKVHTNQKMMIFLSWFEKRRDDSLINATFDGAYLPGVKHIQAQDIDFKRLGHDITGLIESCYSSADSVSETEDIGKRLISRLNLMLKEIESLLPVLNRAVGFSDNLILLMKDSKREQRKLDYVLKKLSETDRIIESKKNSKDMISFTIQKVVHTITEGYEIDEDDKNLSDDELVAKRSQYMYSGLLEGAKFNTKVLTKMVKILEGGGM